VDDVGDEGSERFTLPVPPPGFPPDKDVMFYARRDQSEKRDHEDIMLRRVPTTIAYRFRGAAGARGLTHAQYLAALVSLHEAMRQRADGGDHHAAELLQQLGLATVSI
jgi:hypothetical protein